MSIRGVVYDMSQMQSIDYTATLAIKSIIDESLSVKPKILVKFSRVSNLFKGMLLAVKIKSIELGNCGQSTQDVIATMIDELLKGGFLQYKHELNIEENSQGI